MSNLFDVYPIYDIEPVKARGSYLWDQKGTKYTDFTADTPSFLWVIVIPTMWR